MRIDSSKAVDKLFPDLEDILWNISVYSKEADPDIKLMGLRVRVRKSRTYWYGWAFPWEESYLYGRLLVHPAGRIDMGIPSNICEDELVTLFAHELRHIGQFHRGRKCYGYLTAEYMESSKSESDCYEFEKYILDKYAKPQGICAKKQQSAKR